MHVLRKENVHETLTTKWKGGGNESGVGLAMPKNGQIRCVGKGQSSHRSFLTFLLTHKERDGSEICRIGTQSEIDSAVR